MRFELHIDLNGLNRDDLPILLARLATEIAWQPREDGEYIVTTNSGMAVGVATFTNPVEVAVAKGGK